jgi:hypothetical protein
MESIIDLVKELRAKLARYAPAEQATRAVVNEIERRAEEEAFVIEHLATRPAIVVQAPTTLARLGLTVDA